MSLKDDGEKSNSPMNPSSCPEDHGEDKSERHIVWDEESILEHDKLRGTRMKVSGEKLHSDVRSIPCLNWNLN